MKKRKNKNLEKNLPYHLIRVGTACNAKCLFCNVPPEEYLQNEMSTNEVKNAIKQLATSSQNARLDISGGEPTVRNDLPALIGCAVKSGIKVIQIQTNGILLADKNYVKKLKKAGLNKIFASLHSQMPEVHDCMAGVNGAFAKCVSGIKNSLSCGIEVILNPVITVKNYKSMPGYITYVKQEFPEIKFISLSVVQPRGRARMNIGLLPRYRMIDPYIRKALRLGKRYGLIINNPYCGLPLCIGGWDKYQEQSLEYCSNILKDDINAGDVTANQDKVKPPQCSACDLKQFCGGVWKEYGLVHPLSDLKPIVKNQIG